MTMPDRNKREPNMPDSRASQNQPIALDQLLNGAQTAEPAESASSTWRSIQAELDLLVDGELSPAAERALLHKLEALPGGWRQCALAFIEARAWREAAQVAGSRQQADLLPKPAPPVLLASPAKASVVLPPRAAWRGISANWTALATGLLIAFTLGALVRDNWPERRIETTLSQPNVTSQSTQPTPIPQTPENAPSMAAESVANSASSENKPRLKSEQIRMSLVNHDNSSPVQSIDVPLIPVDEINPQILNALHTVSSQSALPPELRKNLEQAGQAVLQRTYLVASPLPDGRTAIVPVQRTLVVPRMMLAQ